MVTEHPGLTATEVGKLLSTHRRSVKWGTISSELYKLCRQGLLQRRLGVSVVSTARRAQVAETLKEVNAKIEMGDACPRFDPRYTAWRYYPVA